MSRHLTWRFWLYAGISAALFIIASSSRDGEAAVWFIALSPFAVVLTLSVLSGWWVSLEVERVTLSQLRLIEGDELSIFVDVRCPRPIAIVELEMQYPASMIPVTPPRVIQPIDGDSRVRFDVRVEKWGVTGPEFLNVVTRDRFGLSETIQQFPLSNRVHVHPPTERIRSMVRAAQTRSAIGDHRSTARGPGVELAEVRNYNPSDPVRLIHAMLSLRRGKPMVADRNTDQATDVILFIDAVQDVGETLDSTLRSTVAAATGLQERHFRSMDRVGILDRSTGVRWLPPALGRRAGHIIVDTLLSAKVMQDRRGDLPTIPLESLDGRSLILAVSPLYSEVFTSDLAQLRRRGHSVVVLLVQRHLDTGASSIARRVTRITNEWQKRRLAELGVVVLPWDPSGPVEPVLQKAVLAGQRPMGGRGSIRQPSASGFR